VITPVEIVPGKKEKTLASRIAWLALIAATLCIGYFTHLGALGFVGPDEPRYAWIARDMAETGDWVTPRLYGRPWFEKPPLYYWGAALSFKIFGVSEASARLPSAFLALLATLALAQLTWRLYGAETARWLLLLLPTTIGMIGFSHAASTDMPFSATLTIAMVAAAAIVRLDVHSQTPERSASTPWPALILFGLFLGLAVLAKGPAAIILCGGALFFWALFTKRWRDAFRLFHPAAVAIFCFTALPWYILCARRNPDFLRIFFLEHNFKRYLTPEFQHIQPLWFYLPVVFVALLPWTPLLLRTLSEIRPAFQNRLNSGATPIFVTCWAIFPCLFFSFSRSKLPGYILPAIPPLVLLCSGALTKILATHSRLARAVLISTSIFTFILIAVAFQYSSQIRGLYQLEKFAHHSPGKLAIFGLVCLLSFIAALAILLGRSRTGVFLTAASLLIFFSSAALATLDSILSPRQLCQSLAKLKTPGEELLLCSIPRSYVYAFNFYLRREVPEWSRRTPGKPALVVIGSPACWSHLEGARYHLRPEMDFARWPVIELEAVSAAGLPAGRQSQ